MSSLASRPARLYEVLALAEMVTWTLLLLGMFGKYVLDLGELGVRIGGSVHGFVFLSYCLVTVLVAVDQRWRPGQALLGLASAIVPYATWPFERYARRRGLLGHSWRLRHDEPVSAHERVAGAAIRRPLPATLVALVGVCLVFATLLALGNPKDWFLS